MPGGLVGILPPRHVPVQIQVIGALPVRLLDVARQGQVGSDVLGVRHHRPQGGPHQRGDVFVKEIVVEHVIVIKLVLTGDAGAGELDPDAIGESSRQVRRQIIPQGAVPGKVFPRPTDGKLVVAVVVGEQGDADLPQVGRAGCLVHLFLHRAEGRDQEAHEDRDDGHGDEHFQKSETLGTAVIRKDIPLFLTFNFPNSF